MVFLEAHSTVLETECRQVELDYTILRLETETPGEEQTRHLIATSRYV